MISLGQQHTFTIEVPEHWTVPNVFPESTEFQTVPRVFATAFMVGAIEWACMESIRPSLADNEISVGTHVDVSHDAPTLPGMQVSITTQVSKIDGRTVWFDIEAADDGGVISRGRHSRAILDRDRFVTGVNKRNSEFTSVELS